jgi:hypothetical protein
MQNGIQTKDHEITEAKLLLTKIASKAELPTKASAPPSQKQPIWKLLFSFPYSVELMDSLMAFVGLLLSLLAFLFVLTVFIEHLYHLFFKN